MPRLELSWYCVIAGVSAICNTGVPRGALLCIPTPPLPVQLQANSLGEATEEGLSVCVSATHTPGKSQVKLLLASAWPRAGFCYLVESEPVNASSLFLSFSISIFLSLSLVWLYNLNLDFGDKWIHIERSKGKLLHKITKPWRSSWDRALWRLGVYWDKDQKSWKRNQMGRQ